VKAASKLDSLDLPVAHLMAIDAACDRFEAACRAGGNPDLGAYLSQVPHTAKMRLFRSLLSLDLEYRIKRGDQADSESYCRRFPDLAGAVESVFRSQHPFPIQAEEGSSLEGERLGETKTAAGIVAGREFPHRDELGADAIEELKARGYEALDFLGRGGMGVVYKARQIALNRAVALKLIRSGSFASETELARFQNEAEAVAQLDHPHIVPIYEVGRHRGSDFFSMKWIAGASLDRRLADFAAAPYAVARLVGTVAEAIHHAHERGILHLDLKPANILLDESGQPHVTDFGLARRLDAEFETAHSNVLMGTPSYMAPEQAARTRGGLTTATDVYGLGTVLYALLAGKAPFSGTTLVETLDRVRNQPADPPSRTNPRVPRSLETICQKCLEKEPGRRYASARAVCEDLDRWLRGEPILARPVGPVVRAALWCRRKPALATLAALLLLAVLGGFAGVTWMWREADRQRVKTEAVNTLLTRRLLPWASSGLNPLGKNYTVAELLDRAAAELGGWVGRQPDVEAKIRETIGGSYLALGIYKPAEEHLREAIRLDREVHGLTHRDTLSTTGALGTLLDRTGRSAEAEPLLRENLGKCRHFLGPDDPVTLDAAERLGTVLWHLGSLDLAEAVLRKNVDDRRRVLTPEHDDTLRSVYLLSRLLRERGQLDLAEKLAYLYAHSIRCARGTNHPDLIVALVNQGDVARDQHKYDLAERFYRFATAEARRIFGAEHRDARAAEAVLAERIRAER
jgi:serine/threonine-protein kinase